MASVRLEGPFLSGGARSRFTSTISRSSGCCRSRIEVAIVLFVVYALVAATVVVAGAAQFCGCPLRGVTDALTPCQCEA